MKRLLFFLKSQPLLSALSIVLLTALLLGDGKQTVIDIVSAGGTLSLLIVARLFCLRQREMPMGLLLGWFFFFVYLIARTIFSDDVGYSVYAAARWIEVYLLFYVFFTYSSIQTIQMIPWWILGFSLFSLFISALYTFIPFLGKTLTLTNLLTPVYGHNHIIDVLLLGFPVALLWLMQKNTWKALIIVVIFYIGAIFSFGRAGIVLTAILSAITTAVYWKQLRTRTKRFIVVILVLYLTGGMVVFLTPKQNIKQLSGVSGELSASAYNFTQKDIRFEYWRQAIASFKERPFFGSGPGTFVLQSKRLQAFPSSYSTYAHNSILELVVEMGLTGAFFCFCFTFWFIRRTWTFYHFHKNVNRNLATTFLVIIGVQVIYSLIDFTLAYFLIQTVFVLCITAVVILFSPQSTQKHLSTQRYLYTGSVIVISIFYCMELLQMLTGGVAQ